MAFSLIQITRGSYWPDEWSPLSFKISGQDSQFSLLHCILLALLQGCRQATCREVFGLGLISPTRAYIDRYNFRSDQ